MIQYLIIDVDGTMTDGGIYYDEHGNETKKFCTKDAAGFFAAHQLRIQLMVVTGRECRATERRMKELKVDYLRQNVKDKVAHLTDYFREHNVSWEDVGYIGDDLNDLPAMRLAGYVGCPADSCREVKEAADYISAFNGGNGAVRDVIETLLRSENLWDNAVCKVYGIGV